MGERRNGGSLLRAQIQPINQFPNNSQSAAVPGKHSGENRLTLGEDTNPRGINQLEGANARGDESNRIESGEYGLDHSRPAASKHAAAYSPEGLLDSAMAVSPRRRNRV
jgi:hypothetical protein